MAKHPYVLQAQRYIRGVLSGAIPACQWVVAACVRQQQDLERSKKKDFPYKFVKVTSEEVCEFLELMPHIKGPKARNGELIELEDWQCFILTTVFGWVDKKTGFRRFRRVYIEVPRGNAKSTLSSGVALYMLTADGEAGPEVYSAATTRDQAKIVFGDARKMVRKRRDMIRHYRLDNQTRYILCGSNDGEFKPLSRDGETQDGLNIHFACLDEVHAHKTREVYDVVETGAGKRDQSLIWAITTAGFNRSGICYETRTYVVQILRKVLTQWPDNPYLLKGDVADDEQQFGIIYTLDDGDDWTDPKAWQKANPNWGISVMPEYVGGLAHKAMQLASAQNSFKTKHLNLWVNADVAWMDMRAWDACADYSLTLEDFENEEAILALDLASKVDLAAKVYLFMREIEERNHYYLFTCFYLPQKQIEESGNASYEGWAADGWITATEGEVLDFELVESELKEDHEAYSLKDVAYDPWQATQLAQRLSKEGLPMVEYRQTVAYFSEPMKTLEALVLEGRLHHNGNPVMAWCISNVVSHKDAKENIYPRKERDENKIDGAVAAIMALGRSLNETTEEFDYEGM